MAPTFTAAKKGYAALWDDCSITKTAEAAHVADRIIANKDAYLNIERILGVPWIMVGAIHMREANLSMGTHLHNGDSLRGYTYHVPAGRPKVGHPPPFNWVESAVDALKQRGLDKTDSASWNVELMLFGEEGYNGWGYLSKGNSPYIWAWTSEYHGGKYVADHVYSATTWDVQPGCAAIMKALAAKDPSAKLWVSRRQAAGTVPAGATKRATAGERKAAGAGAASAAAATGSEVGTPKPASDGGQVAYHMMHGTVIVIGLAAAVVAAVLIAKKTKLIKERFTGTVVPVAPAATGA